MEYYLGIDIGGTKCAVCLCEASQNRISDKISFATNQPRGWRAVVEDIIAAAEKLLARNKLTAGAVRAAGISCGGPLNSKTGVIKRPPNLPDWDEVPITKIISERFGFPAYVQNDANACAIAEWKYGAGRGCRNMVFLTFGTGMGAGLILDGRLYSGTNDMAGEVGHIRLENDGPSGYGKNGSFEGFCSGGGIARLARERAAAYLAGGGKTSVCKGADEIEAITAKTLALAANDGDEFSLDIYRICGEKLGKGLAMLVDILNPEKIVIGSIFARSQALLRESMERTLKAEAIGLSLGCCEIAAAQLGDDIGDFAAVGVAAAGFEGGKAD